MKGVCAHFAFSDDGGADRGLVWPCRLTPRYDELYEPGERFDQPYSPQFRRNSRFALVGSVRRLILRHFHVLIYVRPAEKSSHRAEGRVDMILIPHIRAEDSEYRCPFPYDEEGEWGLYAYASRPRLARKATSIHVKHPPRSCCVCTPAMLRTRRAEIEKPQNM